MSWKSFFKRKPILRNLVYLIGALIGVILLTSLMLRIYTHHGKTYPVPDLKGLTVSEVKREVKENKLRYQIFDSIFVPDAVPGTVMTQFPQAGNRVKQNRLIFVTMSSLSPEKVKVPDVVDVSLREAQGRLVSAGLKMGRIEYRPSEFFNLVLAKNLNGRPIPENTFVNKGTAIDLVVGRGLSDEKTIVPELIGMKAHEAQYALEAIGLNIGALVFDTTVTTALDSSEAIIWRQRPENSSTEYIEIGSSIDLWLTLQLDDPSFEPEIIE